MQCAVAVASRRNRGAILTLGIDGENLGWERILGFFFGGVVWGLRREYIGTIIAKKCGV